MTEWIEALKSKQLYTQRDPDHQEPSEQDKWIHAAKDIVDREMPEIYKDSRITDFPIKLVERISKWNWHGVFITGQVGSGKTYLANAINRQALVPGHGDGLYGKYKPHCYPDKGIKFQCYPSLVCEIKSTFNNPISKQTEFSIIENLIKYEMLIIDDIGSENQSDFSWSTLHLLLTKRMVDGKRTIVTTNLGLKEIDEIEPRLASRLGSFLQIKMLGVDRRIERGKE